MDTRPNRTNLLANNLHITIEKKEKKKISRIFSRTYCTLLRIYIWYVEKNQHASRDVSASKIIQRTSLHVCSREASFLNIEMYSRECVIFFATLSLERERPDTSRGLNIKKEYPATRHRTRKRVHDEWNASSNVLDSVSVRVQVSFPGRAGIDTVKVFSSLRRKWKRWIFTTVGVPCVASRTPLAGVYTCTLDRWGRGQRESHNVGSYYSTFSTRVLETDGTQTTLEVGKRENIQRTIGYRRGGGGREGWRRSCKPWRSSYRERNAQRMWSFSVKPK